MRDKVAKAALAAILLLSGGLRAAEIPMGLPGDERMDIIAPGSQVSRWGHCLTYDSKRNRTVLFGGTAMYESDYCAKHYFATMEYDGQYWRGVNTAHQPDPTKDYAMAYDAARGVTVLFGGTRFACETWTYDGTNWTQRAPLNSPCARTGQAMAYDSLRERVLLFGGNAYSAIDYSGALTNDLWAWDGANWTDISPSVRPSVRSDAVMAYDSTRDRTVVFGGWELYFNTFWQKIMPKFLNDTWEWNGTAWNQASTNLTPSPYYSSPGSDRPAMAYDAARQVSVLVPLYMPILHVRHEWNGAAWTVRTNKWDPVNGDPNSNIGGGQIAYDSARQRTVLYTGNSLSQDRRTYELQGTNWWAAGGFVPDGATLYKYGGSATKDDLAWTDMNGDGRPDVVRSGVLPAPAATSWVQAVAVYTNTGGELSDAPAWSTAIGAKAAVCGAAGDVNGDGRPDLALASDRLQVLTNNGAGYGTGAVWRSAESYGAYDLAWVDVDNDGDADLTALGTNTMFVYRNQNGVLESNRTVLATIPNSADGLTPWIASGGHSAWADFDGNNSKDLAVSWSYYAAGRAYTAHVGIFTNHHGTFGLSQVLSGFAGDFVLGGYSPKGSCIAAGDINGDSRPDLVGDSWVYLNDGGGFGASPSFHMIDLLDDSVHVIAAVELGDVDGDGDPDLLVSFGGGDAGVVHLEGYYEFPNFIFRNDAGQFTYTPVWMSEAELSAPAARLVDVDGDGILDVAAGSGIYRLSPVSPTILKHPPAPKYVSARSGVPLNQDITVTWDAVADPDVNGYRILCRRASDISGLGVPWKDWADVAKPASATSHVLSACPPGRYEFRVRTVDKAGRQSLDGGPVAIDALAAANSVNDGLPDFSCDGYILDASDLDADGDLDLFAESTHPAPLGDSQIAPFSGYRWESWTNSGNGHFEPAWFRRQSADANYPYGPGNGGTPVSLGDVNGDGRPDLLVLKATPFVDTNTFRALYQYDLHVYAATNGGFADTPCSTSRYDYAFEPDYQFYGSGAEHTPQWRHILAWGDVDGDGDLDLVAAQESQTNSQVAAVLFRNTGGTLSSTGVWRVVRSGESSAIAFGDVNSDGKADLAYGAATNVSVFLGQAGGLATSQVWSASKSGNYSTFAVSWADFDSDSDLDLTLHLLDNNLPRLTQPTVLYRNNGGTLTASPIQTLDATAGYSGNTQGIGESHEWADLDDDGDLDLLGIRCIIENEHPAAAGGPIGSPSTNHWIGFHQSLNNWQCPFFEWLWTGDLRQPYAWPDLLAARDFNGDGTKDFLLLKAIVFRKPHSLLPGTVTPVATGVTYNHVSLSPSGPITLNGPGASQAFTVSANGSDVTAGAILYVDSQSESWPVVAISNNVVAAVGNGDASIKAKVRFQVFSENGDTYDPVVIHVSGISMPPEPADVLAITPVAVTMTRQGEAVPLTVTTHKPLYGECTDVTPACTLVSLAPAVAAVNGKSVVALADGMADVVAQYGGMSVTAKVTVALAHGLSGISIHPSLAAVEVGDTCGFEVRAEYAGGVSLPVTFQSAFSSSAPGVASVWGTGLLGESAGEMLLTASYLGMTAQARVVVTDRTAATKSLVLIHGVSVQADSLSLDWYSTGIHGFNPRCTILRATNLDEATPWTPLTNNLPRSPSGFNAHTLPLPPDDVHGFYRVSVTNE